MKPPGDWLAISQIRFLGGPDSVPVPGVSLRRAVTRRTPSSGRLQLAVKQNEDRGGQYHEEEGVVQETVSAFGSRG